MKRFFIVFAMLIACVSMTMAQEKQASIRFEKINYNFGKFSEKEPVQKCVFTFVTPGPAPPAPPPAPARRGRPIPSFTKTPIKLVEKCEIKVTYNGRGTFPGHFKKTITVRSNGVTELTRLYIEGVMEEAK